MEGITNMDAKLLKSITARICRRFPEVAGSQPKVSPQTSPQAKSGASEISYLITYRGQVKLPEGKSIPRIVRVTANSKGQILKVSTSR
jgi:hypothetical protein